MSLWGKILAFDSVAGAVGRRKLHRRLCGEFGFHLRYHLVLFAPRKTGAGRDETADDDVFLEADEAVYRARNGRFGELPRGVLERDGGEERRARERYLGDAEQELFAARRLFLVLLRFLVHALEFEIGDDVARREARIAGTRYRDAAEHLLDDYFEVLARGRNALQFVDASDLVDDVFLRALFPGEQEKLLEVGRAVGKKVGLLHRVSLLDDDAPQGMHAVLGLALRGFPRLRARGLGDDGDDRFRAVLHDIGNDAGDAGHRGRRLGHAALEYLLDARQAHGDVAARRRDAPRVEGAHRELGSRLADRLRGDDADGFAEVGKLARREV